MAPFGKVVLCLAGKYAGEMQRRFNILSLSGGGYMGLFTAHVLEALEHRAGKPIGQCFDLIAGTSIGGILALAVAAEVPMSTVRAAFENDGETIFSSRPAPKGGLSKGIDLLRSLFSAKYTSVGLEKTLTQFFPENRKVGTLPHRCIVASINATTGLPRVFKTAHHPDFFIDRQLRLVDVSLATSAAPTIFPLAEINGSRFVDGGLFANSPDLIAVHEAEHFLKEAISDLHVLSVGTTRGSYGVSGAGPKNMGIWAWMSSQKLLQIAMSAQQQSVDFVMKHRLGGRYVRLDATLSPAQQDDLAMDVATDAARTALAALAGNAIQNRLGGSDVLAFLNHSPPSPTFYGDA